MSNETRDGAAKTVSVERAVDLTRRVFLALDVPGNDATKAAVALIDADVHGVSTHGIANLPNYVRAIQSGIAVPRPEVRVTGGTGAMLQMSGGHGLGHVVAYDGMEQAITLARTHGVGCVFMSESNHYGTSGYWARLAAREKMAGFAFTNAPPTIAPWGGTEAMVGNNPPAWALPGSLEDGTEPSTDFCLDMALSEVAGNRLLVYAQQGKAAPPHWSFDREGQPTTDPLAFQSGGSLAPVGGFKGYGMALTLSMLASFLADGAFDYDQYRYNDDRKTDEVAHAGRCHWFMAFDIARVVSPETFGPRVREVVTRIHNVPRKPGIDRILLPGENGEEHARQQRRKGIAYQRTTLDRLKTLADTLGVTFDL